MGALYYDKTGVGWTEYSLKQNTSLRIHPNPFSTSTTISFESEHITIYSIKILDLKGSLIRSINNIKSNNITIQRGKIAPGLYVIEVESAEGNVFRGKISVN